MSTVSANEPAVSSWHTAAPHMANAEDLEDCVDAPIQMPKLRLTKNHTENEIFVHIPEPPQDCEPESECEEDERYAKLVLSEDDTDYHTTPFEDIFCNRPAPVFDVEDLPEHLKIQGS